MAAGAGELQPQIPVAAQLEAAALPTDFVIHDQALEAGHVDQAAPVADSSRFAGLKARVAEHLAARILTKRNFAIGGAALALPTAIVGLGYASEAMAFTQHGTHADQDAAAANRYKPTSVSIKLDCADGTADVTAKGDIGAFRPLSMLLSGDGGSANDDPTLSSQDGGAYVFEAPALPITATQETVDLSIVDTVGGEVDYSHTYTFKKGSCDGMTTPPDTTPPVTTPPVTTPPVSTPPVSTSAAPSTSEAAPTTSAAAATSSAAEVNQGNNDQDNNNQNNNPDGRTTRTRVEAGDGDATIAIAYKPASSPLKTTGEILLAVTVGGAGVSAEEYFRRRRKNNAPRHAG